MPSIMIKLSVCRNKQEFWLLNVQPSFFVSLPFLLNKKIENRRIYTKNKKNSLYFSMFNDSRHGHYLVYRTMMICYNMIIVTYVILNLNLIRYYLRYYAPGS